MNTNDNSLTRSSSWLTHATSKLVEAGITTARLDCLLLLEDITNKNRTHLLAHPDLELSSEHLLVLESRLKRRLEHEPLAYIRGKAEFYGREYVVNTHTLQPRPETETMIELLKQIVASHLLPDTGSKSTRDERQETGDLVIVDVGTGSGCIAITAKLELPSCQVFATDIDPKCIETAHNNSAKLGAEVNFYEGNLLAPLLSTFNFQLSTILANLPYVPHTYQINRAAQYEPRHAIYGGSDGLDLYRELFAQIITLESKPEFVITESLPFQHKTLQHTASISGYKLLQTEDFIQIFQLLD